MTGRLLTARQVADTLGVSTETVLRWARHGDLPSIQLSTRAIRIPETQLENWLAERATAPRRGNASSHPGRRHLNAIVDDASSHQRGGD